MSQTKRIIIAVIILIVLIGIMLGVDYMQRRLAESRLKVDVPAGSIPIFLDGHLTASFVPGDLDQLGTESFVDDEEGKTQEGWLLRDVLMLYLSTDQVLSKSEIVVSSSSRDKSVTLEWQTVSNPEAYVLFDLSGRGTLKLVSNVAGFNTRDDWIQDVDRIELRYSDK